MQEAERVKEATVSKQASFMASFFKKPSGPSPSKASAADAASAEGGDMDMDPQAGGATKQEKDQEAAARAHRNFHPWEKPRNAIVAGYPCGPGEARPVYPAPPSGTDLASWVKYMRGMPRRADAAKVVLRADGTPHPKMKFFQLNMMVPVTRTQLLDVDLDAARKVVWDVENDPEEQQLQQILNEAESMPDGLLRYTRTHKVLARHFTIIFGVSVPLCAETVSCIAPCSFFFSARP